MTSCLYLLAVGGLQAPAEKGGKQLSNIPNTNSQHGRHRKGTWMLVPYGVKAGSLKGYSFQVGMLLHFHSFSPFLVTSMHCF